MLLYLLWDRCHHSDLPISEISTVTIITRLDFLELFTNKGAIASLPSTTKFYDGRDSNPEKAVSLLVVLTRIFTLNI
jgi:hypothetical protein